MEMMDEFGEVESDDTKKSGDEDELDGHEIDDSYGSVYSCYEDHNQEVHRCSDGNVDIHTNPLGQKARKFSDQIIGNHMTKGSK
jgi:hypothetical protein